jgi:hypothetical protein
VTNRYLLPTVLGGALAFGYLASNASFFVKIILLVVMLMNYSLSSARDVKKLFRNGSLLDERAAAVRKVRAMIEDHDEADLPVVISSGIDYLPMAYYKPPEVGRDVYVLVDPPAAIAFAESDTVDRNLLALRRYHPLRVEDYSDFASRHREFILVSTGGKSFD